MGASLCSDNCIGKIREPVNINRATYLQTITEDEYDEDSDSLELGLDVKRVKSAPAPSIINKGINSDKPTFVSSSTGRLSLMQKMEQRRNTHEQFVHGEREAKLYMDAVETDTLNHVDNAVRIASLIVEKTEDITEELVRQGDVIRGANDDIHYTEQDVNQTNYTLKGMKSLRGKLGNMVWRKKPKIQEYNGFETDYGSAIRNRSVSAPPKLELDSPAVGSKQQQIKGGLRTLNVAMDTIRSRQLVIGEELQRQDKQLNEFSGNMTRTQDKIKVQSDLMSSMRKGK